MKFKLLCSHIKFYWNQPSPVICLQAGGQVQYKDTVSTTGHRAADPPHSPAAPFLSCLCKRQSSGCPRGHGKAYQKSPLLAVWKTWLGRGALCYKTGAWYHRVECSVRTEQGGDKAWAAWTATENKTAPAKWREIPLKLLTEKGHNVQPTLLREQAKSHCHRRSKRSEEGLERWLHGLEQTTWLSSQHPPGTHKCPTAPSVPEDLTPSSDLRGHQAYTLYICMCVKGSCI